MPRQLRPVPALFMVAMIIALSPARFVADAQTGICEQFENRVAAEIGRNCSDLASNEACYGYSVVSSLLQEGSTAQPLSEPGDVISLSDVMLFSSTAVDVEENHWGALPLHVQGDIPRSLSDRGLVLMTLGEVQLADSTSLSENGQLYVYPDNPLAVTTSGSATLYAEASSTSDVAGTAASGDEFLADAISADGAWVRVFFEWDGRFARRAFAWISASVLDTFDPAGLPALVSNTTEAMLMPDESFTPMQSFLFAGGDAPSECLPTPEGMLVVQSPKNYETRFVVNGAPVLIASTVAFTATEDDLLELSVLSGLAVLCEGTPNEFVVPEGFAVSLPLLGDDIEIDDLIFGSVPTLSCDWTNLRLLTQAQIDIFDVLEQLPDNILNELIDLPNVICPSGVGNPVCSVDIQDNVILQTFQRLCSAGIITAPVCDRIQGL